MNKVYFKNVNGKKSSPFSIEQFKIKGSLYENDLIWREGLSEWTKAKNIEELKDYALLEPPKTKLENNIIIIKSSFFKSLKYYIIFSFFIGVFSALLEKYQYQDFMNSIDKIDNGNYNEEIRPSEIYASREDGSRYSRWTVYSNIGQDNEQISFDENHKFLFRPYRAIFDVANLSITERENIAILIFNFILSAFLSNLFFLPLLFLLFFTFKKSN
jgi:hypothetical protein